MSIEKAFWKKILKLGLIILKYIKKGKNSLKHYAALF